MVPCRNVTPVRVLPAQYQACARICFFFPSPLVATANEHMAYATTCALLVKSYLMEKMEKRERDARSKPVVVGCGLCRRRPKRVYVVKKVVRKFHPETPVRGAIPLSGHRASASSSNTLPDSLEILPFPLFRAFVCFYKRQESLINDRMKRSSPPRTAHFLVFFSAASSPPAMCYRCDHRVMGAFVWLTGVI